jgi:DNA polymerase
MTSARSVAPRRAATKRRVSSALSPAAAHAAIAALGRAVEACRRCPLYKDTFHGVIGEGPAPAAMMVVGEQPGDQEDQAGRPFVGPAGRILDQAFADADVDRALVYVTNAVKHFKHEQRGKRRLHKRPNRDEVEVCAWWLDQELSVVRPKVIVALGVTAAQSLMGRTVVLARERGKTLAMRGGFQGVVSLHPSAILRMPDQAARREALRALAADLRRAAQLAA